MRIALLSFLLSVTTALAQTGIAAKYPGDVGIASDPSVLLADDFESYGTSGSIITQLKGKWTNAIGNIRLATEPGKVFAGSKSIEMSLPVSTAEVMDAVVKTFPVAQQQDTMFMRIYNKFDAGYDIPGTNHNGIRISAKYPEMAGTIPPADGTGFFLFLLQNNFIKQTEVSPGMSHLYVYWPKQRTQWGDHWYPDGTVVPASSTIGNKGEWLAYPAKYPDFKVMANFTPELGRWYCEELMVKANTPGKNDGEAKYWIDGEVKGDWPNLNLRSIPTLKLDHARFMLHSLSSSRLNQKWYDNAVIATQYIGPMAKPQPTATPSATPSPSPTGTPAPSPTSTPTASPSPLPTSSPSPSATASGKPDAPTDLAATLNPNNSATQVDLSWTDNSDNEKEFRVARSPTGTGFVRIATLAPNTTTYTDMGLSPSSTYYYQVNASNAAGTSWPSNTFKVTTASPTASPTPPIPTPTPKPTPTPTASPTPSPSPSPSPSPTATPTPSPSPSPTPTPTPTPAQTRIVTVEIVNPTKGDTYEIYYGEAPAVYGPCQATLTGAVSAGIPNLEVGKTYYFANKVKDANGVYSVMSDPVSYTVTTAQTQELRLGNEPQ